MKGFHITRWFCFFCFPQLFIQKKTWSLLDSIWRSTVTCLRWCFILYHGKSPLFTTMWENMFTFSKHRTSKSKYIIFFHMGVGKNNPSTQTSLLLPTARSFKTGEAPGSSSASKKRKKGALIRSFYQFHLHCVKLLMVQKSGDHQLRLVFEIPLFTRFYASQVMQVPSRIRVISENRTHTYWSNSGFEYHNYRWFQVIVYFLPRNVWADDPILRLLTTVQGGHQNESLME